MAEQSQRLNVTTDGPILIVELTDRKILDELSITQIGEQIEQLISEQETPRLVMDFQPVSHMSSSALGMLITIHKRVRERDGQLRLCNIQPEIKEVFSITRLDEVFEIHDSRQVALESLR
ncbi:MAG: STAS domain-containing protein [Phycisphaerae bacterium]